jgi:hypothetical protein
MSDLKDQQWKIIESWGGLLIKMATVDSYSQIGKKAEEEI